MEIHVTYCSRSSAVVLQSCLGLTRCWIIICNKSFLMSMGRQESPRKPDLLRFYVNIDLSDQFNAYDLHVTHFIVKHCGICNGLSLELILSWLGLNTSMSWSCLSLNTRNTDLFLVSVLLTTTLEHRLWHIQMWIYHWFEEVLTVNIFFYLLFFV